MEYGLMAIFGAGVLTLASPCVFPMLPVYLALLLGASLDSAKTPGTRFRLLGAAVLFVGGFSLVFTLLGLGASSVGVLLHEHRHLMLIVGGLLIAAFGLKYLGLIRLGFLDRTVKLDGAKTGSKALDGFLFGVVFALGWTPCVGPILGSVLAYTAGTTDSALAGAGYLFVYSMGMGLPLLAISLMAHRIVPVLRRMNRHLPKVEIATGAVMLILGLAIAGQAAATLFLSDRSTSFVEYSYAGSYRESIGAPSSREPHSVTSSYSLRR